MCQFNAHEHTNTSHVARGPFKKFCNLLCDKKGFDSCQVNEASEWNNEIVSEIRSVPGLVWRTFLQSHVRIMKHVSNNNSSTYQILIINHPGKVTPHKVSGS